MYINLFKFGGASLNSAAGIKMVSGILKNYNNVPLVVVVSAMGKTTNALEVVLKYYMENDPIAMVEAFDKVRESHFATLHELFQDKEHQVFGELDSLFNQLRGYIRKGHLYTPNRPGFDHEYDQIVSYGELFSSTILHHYLVMEGINSAFFDIRQIIRTDSTYRDARVDWEITGQLIRQQFTDYLEKHQEPGSVLLTQGFIAGDGAGNTTTLGREGSDFSAAIIAYVLHIPEMTIWKDVPGVMNADPKWMKDAVLLETLSYREAIELSYYGAGVIHPKTIKPLENANIILKVRSYLNPEGKGTSVENLKEWIITTPIFIRKQNQVLISVSPRDFSFIVEENLSDIFKVLAASRVRVNVMQNSAISFSICVDADPQKITPLISALHENYETRYNEGLELITVRHYNQAAFNRITEGRKILMELRSRNTLQLVMA